MTDSLDLDKIIAVGNVVRVTDFIFEFPIEATFPLTGMEGIVTDLYSEDADQIRLTHAQIRWTAETIRSISGEYVQYCAESDFSWTATVVPLEHLEIVDKSADEIDLQWAINEKAAEFFWPAAPEGRKLITLFKSVRRSSVRLPGDAMLDYLRKNVRLPMAVVIQYESDPDDSDDFFLTSGTKATLIGFNGYDSRMNIYAEVAVSERNFILPLEDLAPDEHFESKNARLLDVYLFWLISRL